MADQLDILDEIEVETQRVRASQSADEVSRSARRMQQRVDAARRINNTVIEEEARAALAQLEAHLATLPAHAAPAKEAAAATTMIATDATIVEQELAVHLASQDVATVEQSIQHFKVRAVQAKRAGQSTMAIAYLRASKQLAVHATSLATASLPEGKDVPDEAAAPPDIETLKSRLQAYKVAAVEAKRAGDLAQAREHLGIVKQLQLVLEQQTTTGMTLDYRQIRARLTEQIELATTIAGTAYRRGDKETALHFHKAKKILLTDVEWIDSLQAHHQPMPLIDYRDVSYTLETSNDDLSVNELELVIHRAWDLHGAREASPGPMDVFVQWDNGLEGGKGTSPTVAKQREPVFDYRAKQTIQRNRMLQRHVERKKMVLDVMSYRGFLRGSVCIGRATLKLDGLLKHCTIDEVVPLMEPNSRRATGGQLQVTLRLKTPLLGPDRTKHEERWLYLNHATPAPAATTAVKEVETPKAAVASPSTKAATSANPPAVVAAKSPPVTAAQADSEQLEALLHEFDSVDQMASNMVLEAEQERLQAQLQTKPANAAELRDRLQSVQIKLNMLVLQVQTEALTLPAYIESVRQSIEKTKRHALQFKRLRRMDKAREAMQRLKIMQQEVAEVEQAGLV
ncbi:hypothetical protein SYNPS1DRAFT_23368 [Syncephalis pseudoplumigaleata]|uniref:C2 domain-containing protein n=1 Tax=Syncephalis pseudoplumigaleata TaxID=1712513 RepID=A0A4P9YZT4_9FUNG|nr:hypothetical protein SYNPS1DRAFT_23368 [Syncephalis pseudoplumigaleata]|eukprot:RKP24560.1 hypothetical protein SYNPS1DRAFT_23368 [Syncephalis pseudoplumigaleata]